MAEVVMERLELDAVPEPLPRPGEDPVNKTAPEPGECRLDSLSDLREQELPTRSSFAPVDQEQIQFVLLKLFCQPLSTVAAVAESDRPAASNLIKESQRRIPVVPVAGRQNQIKNPSIDMQHGMQFEAEEPALGRLAEPSPFISQEPHSAMPERMTERYRLGIDQVERLRLCPATARGTEQSPDLRREQVQAVDPLRITAQLREGVAVVLRDQLVALLQIINAEAALHQSDSQHLGIGELRVIVRRNSPVMKLQMCLQIIIHKAVDFRHLVGYRSHGGRPSFARWIAVSQLHSTSFGTATTSFSTHDWD
jgi:hypothetical protein